MSKEKLVRLTRYVFDLTNKLTSNVPLKHKDHPETYKRFLKNEIAATNKVIEEIKLASEGSKGK